MKTFTHRCSRRPLAARSPRRLRGASTVEFVIVAPLLAGIGLGTLQAGLAYHGRTVLNYATLEAARTGAVHHALAGPMRRELAVRLAPLVGGNGSDAAAAAAIARSLASVTVDPFTRLDIVNPSTEAFDHFSIRSRESGKQVIPNSHLRFRQDARAARDPVSGVDLRDANLLRIEVVHGLEMKVPLVGALIRPLLTLVDPVNAAYHAANKIPLRAVATVRMQSEVWRDDLAAMKPAAAPAADVPGVSAVDASMIAPAGTSDPVPADARGDGLGDERGDGPGDGPGNGQDDARPEPDANPPAQECNGPLARHADPFLPTADDRVCAVPGAWAQTEPGSPLPPATGEC